MTIRAYQNDQICLSLDGCVHRLTRGDCAILIAALEAQIGQPGIVGKVKRTVAEAFHVSVAQLESHTRTEALCVPRWICWSLLRESGMKLQAIADEFGGRDHGAVLHGLNALNDRMELKEPLKREIELLRKRVNQI